MRHDFRFGWGSHGSPNTAAGFLKTKRQNLFSKGQWEQPLVTKCCYYSVLPVIFSYKVRRKTNAERAVSQGRGGGDNSSELK